MTKRDFSRVADELAERQRRQEEAQLIETARGGMWPEAHRAMPNDFARSNLFAAVNLRRRERKHLRDVVLASQSGLKVSITSGEELDQADLDVFLGLLHVTREQLLKDECTFRVGTFLKKAIGKTDTTANRGLLHDSLERLRAMSLEIRLGRKGGYVGGLLSGFEYLGLLAHLLPAAASAAQDAAAFGGPSGAAVLPPGARRTSSTPARPPVRAPRSALRPETLATGLGEQVVLGARFGRSPNHPSFALCAKLGVRPTLLRALRVASASTPRRPDEARPGSAGSVCPAPRRATGRARPPLPAGRVSARRGWWW